MAIVAGVDGCKGGWFCAAKDAGTDSIWFGVYDNAKLLLQQQPEPLIIAIDIPIGLPEAGPRMCDIEARKLLGPRRSSVFPAPIRPALQGNTRKEVMASFSRREQRLAGTIFDEIMESRDK